MSKHIRSFVLLAGLLATLTGCSTYRPATLPDFESTPEPKDDPARVVAPHVTARLTLTNGAQVEGDVLRVTADAVVFGKLGNYGLEEIVYPTDRIVAVEVLEVTRVTKTIAVIGAVAAVVLVAYGVLLSVTLRNANLS